ncbi:MAG: hypothetical protein ABMA02_10550 [Saprospiraceae bacterium]
MGTSAQTRGKFRLIAAKISIFIFGRCGFLTKKTAGSFGAGFLGRKRVPENNAKRCSLPCCQALLHALQNERSKILVDSKVHCLHLPALLKAAPRKRLLSFLIFY